MNAYPPIPPGVLANVEQRWPGIAAVWASSLVLELDDLCRKYDAVVRTALPGRYGYVIAAESPIGPLVLRSSPDPHSADQAAVAKALADLGISPWVHEIRISFRGTWTVLDRVIPGTGLNDVQPDSISPAALFRPLAAMRDQPPPQAGMPSILDWLKIRLEDDYLADLRPGTSVASDLDRSAALALLADVKRNHTPALCHGDASSGNIIAHGASGWMYIDPRGMSGDYAYDVAVVATRLLRTHPVEEILREANSVAGVDADRLQAWAMIAEAARV